MESSYQQNEILILMGVGILIMLFMAVAFVLFFSFSQRKLQSEQLKVKEQQLKHQEELLFSNIRTQEEERKRIAKDLHDDIGSKLNVIFLNMHRILRATKKQEPVEEIVDEINGVISQTIETTRRISHDLLPPTLEKFGLVEALKELCSNYENSESVNVLFEVMQNQMTLQKSEELNLFRITQELLNNSLKHGQASQINIRLWLGGQKVQLEYQDDGNGFDLEDFQNKKGLGMKNIESRVQMVNGILNIQSEVGKGVFIGITKSNIAN